MFRATVGAGLLLLSTFGSAHAQYEPPLPAAVNPADPLYSDPEDVLPAAGIGRPFPPDIVPVLPPKPPTPLPPTPSTTATDTLNRLSTPFATQTAGGGFQGRSFNEEFDGDFGGIFVSKGAVLGFTTQQQQIGTTTQRVRTGTRRATIIDPQTGERTVVVIPVFTNVTVPVFGPVQVPVVRTVRVPVAGLYSGIMITDNDSPRPVDRLYFSYSYYDNFGTSLNPGFGDITQNREILGFEKTFFGGNTSFGMRLPFVQITAPFGTGATTVGDLSFLYKWALINNRETGDLLSIGLVITTPTADINGTLSNGSNIPHSTLFQPWLGFVRTFDRGYVQFISNGILPTNNRDVYLWGNSLAFGYLLYRGTGGMPSITPTAEMHVRTPINDRDPNGLVYLQDQLNFTGGVHLRWNRLTVSGAACVPVINPRPWDIEALVNVNFRF
jgi:hypothetical protein